MPLILRLLAWWIMFYRRWLSGRGPLRSVRCSFAAEESCSAYGLRMTAESPSARTAIARIARRLRRCGDVCLRTDGTALSWSPLHDRPPLEITRAMHEDGERPAAIARMLVTRRAVAVWRGESAIVTQLPPSHDRPPVRSQPTLEQRARRRVFKIAAASLVGIALVFVLPWIGSIAAGTALLAGTFATRSLVIEGRRFELHQAWARRRG